MGNSERHRCIGVPKVENKHSQTAYTYRDHHCRNILRQQAFLSNNRSACGIPPSSHRLQSYPTIYVSVQDEVFCFLCHYLILFI